MVVSAVKIVILVTFVDLNFSMIHNHPNVLSFVEMGKNSLQLAMMVITRMGMDALEIVRYSLDILVQEALHQAKITVMFTDQAV